MFNKLIYKNAASVHRYLISYQNLTTTVSTSKEQIIDHKQAEQSPEIEIPEYKARSGESLELRKARLVYQSRKRGMLENGLLLSTFASKYLSGMNEQQVQEYDTLINKPSNDWDLFYWITEAKPTPPEYENNVMKMLKEHVKNNDKETRYRQPDLN